MRNIVIAALLVIAGAAGTYAFLRSSRTPQDSAPPAAAKAQADFCAKHQIAEKDCPWCSPALVASMGECAEHSVPEALCSRCNPKLVAGFQAEHDWCAGHGVPESQCTLCKAGQLPPGEGQ